MQIIFGFWQSLFHHWEQHRQKWSFNKEKKEKDDAILTFLLGLTQRAPWLLAIFWKSGLAGDQSQMWTLPTWPWHQRWMRAVWGQISVGLNDADRAQVLSQQVDGAHGFRFDQTGHLFQTRVTMWSNALGTECYWCLFLIFCMRAHLLEVKLFSHVRLFASPWTVGYQDPQSMEFSRQEYWSGLPFPSPGDLPDPGIEPGSPAL